MSALEPFRAELRALLGKGVLLRRDRAMRALFVCDAGRLADAGEARRRILAAGYVICDEGALWRIDLSLERRAQWIGSLAPGPLPADGALRSLCRSILSRQAPEPAEQPWSLIRAALLYLDAGERERLIAELSAQVAILKRTHAPLPAAAAYIIEATEVQYADLPSCAQ